MKLHYAFLQMVDLDFAHCGAGSKEVGLNFNEKQTKIMRVNSTYPQHVSLEIEALDDI